MIEPTAPPSCPMLECAGPCTRPSPASSSTVSSNARMRWSWPSIRPAAPGRRPSSRRRSWSVRPRAFRFQTSLLRHRSRPSSARGVAVPFTHDRHDWIQYQASLRLNAGRFAMPCATLDPLQIIDDRERTHGTAGPAGHRAHRLHGARPRRGARFFVDVIGCEHVYSLGPFRADDDWMSEHLDVHPRTRDARAALLPLRVRPELRGLPVRAADGQRRSPATATSAVITSRSTSTTSTPRSPTCASRASGCSASRPRAATRARASAGSTSCARGACSSSSSASPTARRTRRGRPCCGTRRGRPNDRRTPARARRGHRPHRRPAPRGDHARRVRARGPHPAGADRRAHRRQPRAGARGAAHARGRGPRHARREHAAPGSRR